MMLPFAVSLASALLVTSSASVVLIPTSVRDSDYISVVNESGAPVRIQVPQGLSSTFPPGARYVSLDLRPEYIVPDPQSSTSLQVHLHHTDGSSSNSSVAVSWATPTSANCSAIVSLAGSTMAGVTRTYPSAVLSDGSAASFHHVILDGLMDGHKYNYTISCNNTAFSAEFSAPVRRCTPDQSYSFAIFGDMGVSQAAHDTVNSISAVIDQLDAVYHIGDLSYARYTPCLEPRLLCYSEFGVSQRQR